MTCKHYSISLMSIQKNNIITTKQCCSLGKPLKDESACKGINPDECKYYEVEKGMNAKEYNELVKRISTDIYNSLKDEDLSFTIFVDNVLEQLYIWDELV